MVWCKFFTPDSSWTWYVIEFDGTDTFFGLVDGFEEELSTDQLNNLIADVSVLVEYWLDDYEREILKGQTLLEFLNQKGSL